VLTTNDDEKTPPASLGFEEIEVAGVLVAVGRCADNNRSARIAADLRREGRENSHLSVDKTRLLDLGNLESNDGIVRISVRVEPSDERLSFLDPSLIHEPPWTLRHKPDQRDLNDASRSLKKSWDSPGPVVVDPESSKGDPSRDGSCEDQKKAEKKARKRSGRNAKHQLHAHARNR